MAAPKGTTTGRLPKAQPNKLTTDVKAMILGALHEKGGQAWLKEQMDKNPAAFMALLGKILPHQVVGEDGGPIVMPWERIELAEKSPSGALARPLN